MRLKPIAGKGEGYCRVNASDGRQRQGLSGRHIADRVIGVPGKGRGMTLVEVLVLIAVLGVFGGMVFKIVHETSRDADTLERRDGALTHAQSIYQELGAIFARQALALAAERGLPPQWAPNLCALPAVDPQTEKVALLTIVSQENENGGDILLTTSLPQGEARTEMMGTTPDLFAAEVAFQYAVEFDGVRPQWKDSVDPGRLPRAVKVEVTVTNRKDKSVSKRFSAIYDIHH